jgi:hypothetical protein
VAVIKRKKSFRAMMQLNSESEIVSQLLSCFLYFPFSFSPRWTKLPLPSQPALALVLSPVSLSSQHAGHLAAAAVNLQSWLQGTNSGLGYPQGSTLQLWELHIWSSIFKPTLRKL